jgi:hypothetical protein
MEVKKFFGQKTFLEALFTKNIPNLPHGQPNP